MSINTPLNLNQINAGKIIKKALKKNIIKSKLKKNNIDINDRFFGHGKKCGETSILNKETGQYEKAVISRKMDKDKFELIYLYTDKNKGFHNQYSGSMKLNLDNDYYVWVSSIASSDGKYKGIGSKLHQYAVERSLQKGCGGNLELLSKLEAAGFHYKNGFEPEHEAITPYIEKGLSKIQKSKIQTRSNKEQIMRETLMQKGIKSGFEMILSYDAIKKMIKTIAKTSILNS